jgi:isopentenyldiphosphate isomerase
MKPKIIIVNEKDKEIGLKERGTLKTEDIYRVTALWITNSKDEILLAKRALTKSNDPGKWGPAVAGTVDEGETYEENSINHEQ